MRLKIHQVGNQRDKQRAREIYRKRPRSLLKLDKGEAEQVSNQVEDFYCKQLKETGLDGYVIGLSGGIDSATVAHLLTRAVGQEKVQAAILPAPHTAQRDVEHALSVTDKLQLSANNYQQFRREVDQVIDKIGGWVSLDQDQEEKKRLRRGNILARLRMITLRDLAKRNNLLVAGTTNASEKMLGYMTLAADGKGGVDNEALYNLFKTSVYDLARELGVKEEIINKEPSADLWANQKDKDELGHPYSVLDPILVGYQLELDLATMARSTGQERTTVKKIINEIESSQYKKQSAPTPSFTDRP